MSLGRLLKDMMQRDFERAAGRITYFPNLWRWIEGEPPDWAVEEIEKNGKVNAIRIHKSKDKHNEFIQRDENGRYCELIYGKSVICPNTELWADADKYPHTHNGKFTGAWWVSLSECRKCQFYCKAKDTRYKWPTCRWVRERHNKKPETVAAEETLKTVSRAVDQVNEWMR